jgi:hypothetical protein
LCPDVAGLEVAGYIDVELVINGFTDTIFKIWITFLLPVLKSRRSAGITGRSEYRRMSPLVRSKDSIESQLILFVPLLEPIKYKNSRVLELDPE